MATLFTGTLSLNVLIKNLDLEIIDNIDIKASFDLDVKHHSHISVTAGVSDELHQFPDIDNLAGLPVLSIFKSDKDISVKPNSASDAPRLIKAGTFIVVQDANDLGKFYFSNAGADIAVVECIIGQLSA